ncbi:ferredoxin--NADP reductase [Halalkalicoccus jeotgali]|uniref:Oxidoreductase FAD-binding domain protein n=1 Tax=Halalkalicoccus jeotgali (strain DSM 18796 / CECT 7217 / JCM 14584 / KCTC 4019 / B3) TaxID=795797 RepID=D8J8L6_HALJB|nr:FAD-dependent oxidoreductase [Halalkalicoccus jeotgali]ADJ16262.1 Oxidoreductase FAD-binding domain protein [Halalkalicoccus jeotgali B3]ELY36997.1 Oxidoreductase FAD-binding domain-containing protein [Halalkalicoccus jeotgali B3]
MEPTRTTITAVREVGADTVAVDLETPDGFDAQPGQFLKLSTTIDGEHVSRFYTLSSPDVDGTIEITIGIDPEGELGPWIADAEGATVTVEGPYGSAYYEDEDDSLILAGGPGVGPAVGIGERALADGNTVTIVYCDDEPVHEERLNALRDEDVTVVVTDELEDHVASYYDGGQVFVYGFQDFVTEALEALEEAGGDLDDAKVENFG